MKYVAEYKGWNIWQAEDGSMEAWKSKGIISQSEKGEKWANGVDRMVLLASGPTEAMDEIDQRTKKQRREAYDPYTDPSQTRIE